MNNKFKIISYILCVFLLTPNFFSGADAIEKVRIRDSELFEYFDVYTDNGSSLNHFYPSGWMGDTNDIDLVENCTNNPYSGRTCLKINYTAKATQGKKWAGIYWQDPGNNWGDKKGGFDLTGMEELVFYARGENGSEIGDFKIGGIPEHFSDIN